MLFLALVILPLVLPSGLAPTWLRRQEARAGTQDGGDPSRSSLRNASHHDFRTPRWSDGREEVDR
jgi:hypothetical protein